MGTRDGLDGSRAARVLIAEDCEVNSGILTAMLEDLGHAVVRAVDGEAAVDLFAQQRFDLVLMDLSMPNADGFEATRRIRLFESRHRLPRTPVVATTSVADEDCRAQCVDAGFDDYLCKPVDLYRLRERCDRWLARKPGLADAA